MTRTMADSIYPQTLPAGYDAYLGYVDGKWPTISGYTDSSGVYHPPLRQLFPGKPIVSLTVSGATLNADGCDIEQFDLTAITGAQWLKAKLDRDGGRPVAYCSVTSMAGVLADLAALGVSRSQVRLLSAHYGAGEHICGPSSCNLIGLPLDATQWTDTAPGTGGQIDASLLSDSFLTPSKEDDMLIIKAASGNGYLLSGGKLHQIHGWDQAALYTAAGVQTAGTVSAAEEAALLADFPPGSPAVTVNVPPVTATVGPLTASVPAQTIAITPAP
jgi:hypothetical protein